MTNPCQIGFRCPLRIYKVNGNSICFFHPAENKEYFPDAEEIPPTEEVDCPLVKFGTPLATYLAEYDRNNGVRE